MPRLPDGEPVRLDPGNHDDPGAGRCLMEHVSVLAGEPFRAWPRCTHPAVAALATQVNDRCSPEGRAALLGRAEALARADSDDPALTWRLVALTAEATLVTRPYDRGATRRLARARRSRRLWGTALPGPLARRLPRWALVSCGLAALDELVAALHGLVAVAGPPGSPERDIVLVALLDSVLDAVLDEAPDDRPAVDAIPRQHTRKELVA
ncbi:hypothetical protein EV188_107145 [Actinomycetospora succinea]|uniref:Uncharacterized protein n=1 Tax=Actinomycetospora succinea TaxID=663603 RepID=A0A4R6V8R0_9PSEU|nr:hypothetical protein [Actinomycetospora succinea]TDQ52768.1 hypothetical protein EV188_107145 [Actinomycetospora succinea]